MDIRTFESYYFQIPPNEKNENCEKMESYTHFLEVYVREKKVIFLENFKSSFSPPSPHRGHFGKNVR